MSERNFSGDPRPVQCVCCGEVIIGVWIDVKKGRVCRACAKKLGEKCAACSWDGHRVCSSRI